MLNYLRSSVASQSVGTAYDRGGLAFSKVSHKIGDQDFLYQAPLCRIFFTT
jgi:hypothetical protein